MIFKKPLQLFNNKIELFVKKIIINIFTSYYPNTGNTTPSQNANDIYKIIKCYCKSFFNTIFIYLIAIVLIYILIIPEHSSKSKIIALLGIWFFFFSLYSKHIIPDYYLSSSKFGTLAFNRINFFINLIGTIITIYGALSK